MKYLYIWSTYRWKDNENNSIFLAQTIRRWSLATEATVRENKINIYLKKEIVSKLHYCFNRRSFQDFFPLKLWIDFFVDCAGMFAEWRGRFLGSIWTDLDDTQV
jgi:hypothetical protein